MRINKFLTLALVAALSLPALAQVGSPLPATKLDDFTQTKAKSLDDYVGRALVIEFFAHW